MEIKMQRAYYAYSWLKCHLIVMKIYKISNFMRILQMQDLELREIKRFGYDLFMSSKAKIHTEKIYFF